MALRLEHAGDVAVLVLDRPPVNALDLDLILALEAATAELEAAAPRALVLTGAGGVFSAGVDTRAFAAYAPAERTRMILAITRMIGRLYGLPFPVVAAAPGHAMGGGFVLMLAGDVRLAADDPQARLGLQEARAGIPFPAGPLEVIRAELSPELLRRLTLTSLAVSAAKLHALGVIDQLAPGDELLPRALATAGELAGQPAFRAVKAQVRGPALERLRALAHAGEDSLTQVH